MFKKYGSGIINKEGLKPFGNRITIVPEDRAPFNYLTREGGLASAEDAVYALKEVQTFQEPTTAAVFGSWWAALPLKDDIMAHTGFFPFMAIEGPAESGKTTGYFSLMVQLNGNYGGPIKPTPAALRDRLSAHRNGIVWLDDLSDWKEELDLIRLATAEQTLVKTDLERRSQVSSRLMAPVMISGESLGAAVTQKAYRDRAVLLKVKSPVGRMSLHNPKRPQWDDVKKIERKWDENLTVLAGKLVHLTLCLDHLVDQHMPRLMHRAGRDATKLAILEMGSIILGALTGDKHYTDQVKDWIDEQEDTSDENDLTLNLIPTALRVWNYPDGAIKGRNGGYAPAFIRKNRVFFSEVSLADWALNYYRQGYVERTMSQESIRSQRVVLGDGPRSVRVDAAGSHNVRLRYWQLDQDMSDRVIERARGKS